MLEGSAPSTRFSATALLLGCTKRTASAEPMLNPCQLIAVFWLVWVIVVLPGLAAMLALPADTAPPMGRARTLVPNARVTQAAIAVMAKRER